MSLSSFKYSVRLPLPTGPLSPDWLGPKFIATLDALTPIDPKHLCRLASQRDTEDEKNSACGSAAAYCRDHRP